MPTRLKQGPMFHARCRVAFVGPTYGYPPSYYAWRCIRHWANVFDIGPMTVRLKFTVKLDRFCIGPTSNFSNDLACGYLRTWQFIGHWANVFDIGPMTVRLKFTVKLDRICIGPTSIFSNDLSCGHLCKCACSAIHI
jgi:hypothetical protein